MEEANREKSSAQEDHIPVDRGGFVQPSSLHDQEGGITLIVLSYERQKGLAALLKSLLQQKLNGLNIELILCNNSPRVRLTMSSLSRTGRLLRKFDDVKVFNSMYNWHDSIRYNLATAARYETILFIDDDITLVDSSFIRYMFDTFLTLGVADILSCWNTLWVEWQDDYFSTVSMSFEIPEITEVTECDTCGTGISMFRKPVLLNQRVLEVATRPKFPKAYDMGFSLIAAVEYGSRRYYLPSYGMLKIHKQYTQGALSARSGHYDDRYALYKSLFNSGYEPVLSRLSAKSSRDTPEWRAAQLLPAVKHQW